ncbi:uncharacterized protein LOC111407531 isoform X3 [Olea europaea var. sylvestris]|uniref:uncharacterized protein LOC111407531 isoform X3 n=1 Tax=Olea europaea var. sylvestris TaxID=158386 RepID=UPI000C1D4FD8|nr:uncharacterized protein LOC111407531 isoform X3 [Olea europaea var. sylvestris]
MWSQLSKNRLTQKGGKLQDYNRKNLDYGQMVDKNSPEWLPPGFVEKIKHSFGRKIKYYCNSATGTKYYSKKDVLRCAERENVCHDTPQATSIEDNKLSDDKTGSTDGPQIEPKTTDSPEWLPHGWITEERTRKSGSLMGKTYLVYTEPSTGRKFYTRPTVTRYLETVNHSGNTSKQIKSLSQVDETLSEQPETSRRLILGKESCDRNSSATPEPESLNQDNLVERKADIEKTFEDIDPEIQVRDDKIAVSFLGSDSLNEQKFPGCATEKQIPEALMDLRKSNKRGTTSLPRRTSKRLAGCEPESLPYLGLSTQALQATTKKSAHENAGANEFPWHPETELAGENLAIRNMQKSREASARKVDGATEFPQEPDAEPAQEVANHLSTGKEPVLESEPSNTVQIDPSEIRTIPAVQTSREATLQKVEHNTKSQDSQVDFPFGDFWLDPCLEFAVKTLTGAIPVEDALAFQGYSPAVDAPSNSEPSKQHVPVKQCPVNPPFLTMGNTSFPTSVASVANNLAETLGTKNTRQKF